MSHKGAGEQLSNLTEWLAGAFETARIVVSRINESDHLPLIVT
jgi:hypothetical protein